MTSEELSEARRGTEITPLEQCLTGHASGAPGHPVGMVGGGGSYRLNSMLLYLVPVFFSFFF